MFKIVYIFLLYFLYLLRLEVHVEYSGRCLKSEGRHFARTRARRRAALHQTELEALSICQPRLLG